MGRRRPSGRPPHKSIGLLALMVFALSCLGMFLQFRGTFIPATRLTVIAERAGLVLDRGAKVTYNGVQVGRVSGISEITRDDRPRARLLLDVDPKYISHIPANVSAAITATTVFGNKYVSLRSPKNPASQHITPSVEIKVTQVTTEFDTLFETLTAIAGMVDPVKVNLTLSGAAEALIGLGDRFGGSIGRGDRILDELNPRMPQARRDIAHLAALGDVYADAAPDLWNALDRVATTARTLDRGHRDLDAALLAAAGLGGAGADVFGRGGPYLARGAADLLPTGQLLDEYSPEIFCTLRNYSEVAPKLHNALGNNGYSLGAHSAGSIAGAPAPYLYPENLPRTNAHGGPDGRPGCWTPITRDLWPAPFLVADTGFSISPYNHFELGSPLLLDYVWGRQLGDYTINP